MIENTPDWTLIKQIFSYEIFRWGLLAPISQSYDNVNLFAINVK